MKYLLFVTTCFICILNFACKPKEVVPDFSQISATDSNAQPVSGIQDLTDWRLNDLFTEKENLLFNAITNNSVCDSTSDKSIICYPNPSGVQLRLKHDLGESLGTEFVVVDQNFKIVGGVFQAGNNGLFTVNTFQSLYNGQHVRVYYKIRIGACNFQGHGDVKIVK